MRLRKVGQDRGREKLKQKNTFMANLFQGPQGVVGVLVLATILCLRILPPNW